MHFHRLSSDLEAAAYPALDGLTTSVSTANLERVRRVKGRLVRLTTRVETFRELLEKLLDDDKDMHAMNLTAKEAAEGGVSGEADRKLELQQPGAALMLVRPGHPVPLFVSACGRSSVEYLPKCVEAVVEDDQDMHAMTLTAKEVAGAPAA